MAQEGIILPRAPIVIVDKQWRVGPRASDQGPGLKWPKNNSQLKVQIMGREQRAAEGRHNTKKSVPEKKHQYRFVQSALSLGSTNSKTSPLGWGDTEGTPNDETLSKKSSNRSGLDKAVNVDALPSAASTAFYGNLEDTMTVRYTELLKYYPITITDSHYPLRSKVIFDTNPIGSIWLPFALQDEALLNTIMLSSAVQVASYNPLAYTEIMRQLSHSAIKIVSQRMQAKVLSDATIGAVSCLALIELSLGRQKQLSIHHRGLLEAIRVRGGIRSIDLSLQMKIYRSALLPSVDNLQEPRLPRLRPSTQPLHAMVNVNASPEEPYTTMLARVGLDLDLIDIFLAIRQLSCAVEYAIEHSITINQRAFDEDTMNIFHDLLARPREDVTSLSKACRYAAIVYMNTLTREQPFQPVVYGNVSRALKEELMSLEALNNVTLWVIFMGTMASSCTSERKGYRVHLKSTIEALKIEDWETCHERLRSVCWVDQIHAESGIAVWGEIQDLLMRSSVS